MLNGRNPIEGLWELCLVRGTTHEHWDTQQRLIQEGLFANSARRQSMPNDPAGLYEMHCLQLAADCVEIARFIHLYPPTEWWLEVGKDLVGHFCFVHKRRIDLLSETVEGGPYRPIADAFLAALEAECPPPDWLPPV